MREVEKMVKETSEISERLSEKSKEIFYDIVCYFRVSSIKYKEREDIISDILDMFLKYQEEDKAIEEAIGSDYKSFCDSIIESVNPKRFSLDRAWEYLEMTINGLFVLLTIDCMFNYIPKVIKNKAVIRYDFNVSFFLTSIIILVISVGIVKYIGKNSFKHSKRKYSKKENFLFSTVFILFPISMGVLSYKLSNYVMFSTNGYWVVILISIYWLFKFISKLDLRLGNRP